MQESTPTLPTPAGAADVPRRLERPMPLPLPPPSPKPRLKKLRLALILSGLSILAGISTVFGMMMAVSRDLPSLEDQAQYRAARNSQLVADRDGGPIASLAGNQNRILVTEEKISPNMSNAITAVEDRRFYDHKGVDYRGIARALYQDLRQQRAVQGGSTITQQFVKNALVAQENRTVFQKLRESALAYHLERQWSKQKILTQYLNTIYFGNGAYGIEAAVRTYFGDARQLGPNERATETVQPHEAALLAGIVASPSAYDPVQNPAAARARRDLVLQRMLEQRMIDPTEYEQGRRQALPSEQDINPPPLDSKQPYFSTWVTQQLVDRYDAGAVFAGGLKVKTTLDVGLQERAEQAIAGRIGGFGLGASLVAIENRTGEVKAMVGGSDFEQRPFNLATNGHRQPGSAFKPFILVEALRQGHSANETFSSRKKVLALNRRGDQFEVNNYEDRYHGLISLAGATAQSDNSVFAELGQDIGTEKVARLAQRMGVRTKISTNLAMTLGGLERGVSPLEMAYAYSTIANNGRRVPGTLDGAPFSGPIAVKSVTEGTGDDAEVDQVKRSWKRVYSEAVGQETRRLLSGVINQGTGRAAKLDEFAAGKTGTTENYGDAWFVGFNDQYTVAVWIGYPDALRYMTTEYHGRPVAGGTYPAEIWRDFMTGAIALRDARNPKRPDEPNSAGSTPSTPAPSATTGQRSTPAPAKDPERADDSAPQRSDQPRPQRSERVPGERPPPAPAPTPAPSPSQPGGDSPTGGGAAAGPD